MKSIYDQRYRWMMRLLVDARRNAGYTQARVARMVGWPRTMLSQLETCQRRLDILEACTLCRLYGIRLSRLESIAHGAKE